jgi:hypothetical protein
MGAHVMEEADEGHEMKSEHPTVELITEHDLQVPTNLEDNNDNEDSNSDEEVSTSGTGDKDGSLSLSDRPANLISIQVVLSPPPDPSSYKKVALPPSWYIFRILEEIKTGDEVWYSVEFDDGRIDQVSGQA